MSTYAEKVNSLVAQVDDKGNLPEGVEADEGMQFAVQAEIRRRETQASYTQNQQRVKALELENDKLATNWQADAIATLSPQDAATLEELKTQDPEAWRQKITELEEANRTKFQEKRETISTEAKQLTALEQRMAELKEFNEANPDFVIDDDVIANDIPPRLSNKFKSGEMAFKDFLEAAKKYVDTPKKIKTTEVKEEPNFAGARGSQSPSEEAFKQQSSDDYSKELY